MFTLKENQLKGELGSPDMCYMKIKANMVFKTRLHTQEVSAHVHNWRLASARLHQ